MKQTQSLTHGELRTLVCGKRLFYLDVNRRRITGAISPNVYQLLTWRAVLLTLH